MTEPARTLIGKALSRFVRGKRRRTGPGHEVFFEPVDFLRREGLPPLLAVMVAIWLIRPDLQQAFNLEATAGQDGLLRWSLTQGVKDYRALHDALGRPEVAALYGLRDRSFGAPAPGFGEARGGGVNVLGHLFAHLGVGEDVRCAAAAFAAAHVPHVLVEVSVGTDIALGPHVYGAEILDAPRYATNIFFTSALETLRFFCEKGEVWWIGRRTVGVWPWELPEWPEALEFCLALVDEIWAMSDFVRRAYELASPAPVVLMPPAVVVAPSRADRPAFGLPAEAFVFVAFFDGLSSYDRKNPESAVQVFRAAFPPSERAPRLVVKSIRGKADPERWQGLVRLAQGDSRILFIDGDWTRERTLALLASCDCLVSLHRSEGFGRTLAEAILLRKPVVATHWSGNLDFLAEGEQLLVEGPSRRVEAGEYAWGEGQYWADPDWGAATLALREAARIRTPAAASAAFEPARIGARYRARLEKLGAITPLA
ncbi:glycosyltransferase [uncultured Rhodoblastus sp.]|uniref:glycosyltransferase n=1 Tax=uncultured Rhodoblastus sp. TaxID=543037 RepID=UPI0025ECEC9C|nr:glycosyltransferase [uncultured Rhodoblastus sp.]